MTIRYSVESRYFNRLGGSRLRAETTANDEHHENCDICVGVEEVLQGAVRPCITNSRWTGTPVPYTYSVQLELPGLPHPLPNTTTDSEASFDPPRAILPDSGLAYDIANAAAEAGTYAFGEGQVWGWEAAAVDPGNGVSCGWSSDVTDPTTLGGAANQNILSRLTYDSVNQLWLIRYRSDTGGGGGYTGGLSIDLDVPDDEFDPWASTVLAELDWQLIFTDGSPPATDLFGTAIVRLVPIHMGSSAWFTWTKG